MAQDRLHHWLVKLRVLFEGLVAEYLLVLVLVRCDYFSTVGIGPWHMWFERWSLGCRAYHLKLEFHLWMGMDFYQPIHERLLGDLIQDLYRGFAVEYLLSHGQVYLALALCLIIALPDLWKIWSLGCRALICALIIESGIFSWNLVN